MALSKGGTGLIDPSLIEYYSNLIGTWITGLIWFTGFIAVGSTAKNFFVNRKQEIENIADMALTKLKDKFNTDSSGGPSGPPMG